MARNEELHGPRSDTTRMYLSRKKGGRGLITDVKLVRPVTRRGARGVFAPSPQAPKVRILILNIQVKECSRLN